MFMDATSKPPPQAKILREEVFFTTQATYATLRVHGGGRSSVSRDRLKSDTLNSTQLTQLNSVQPISAKQVSRVFVHDVMSQLGHYVHSIRYDSVCLTCSKKLTGSQLSLPHSTHTPHDSIGRALHRIARQKSARNDRRRP